MLGAKLAIEREVLEGIITRLGEPRFPGDRTDRAR